MPDKPNYTAGYDRTDQDESPAITFKTVFGANAPGGVTSLTTIESLDWSMTGVKIDRDLSEDEWFGLIQDIRKIKRAYLWMLADLLRYGIERGYGDTREKYEAVAKLTGYTPEALQNFASIARSVEISRRRENLSFSHHTEVAPLSPDEQVYWLEQATIKHWSAKRLRAEIATPQLPAETVSDDNGAAPPPDSPTIEDEEEATDIILPVVTLDDPETRQSFSSLQKTIKTGSYHNATYEEAVKIHRQIAVARRALSLLEADLPRLKRGR